MSDRIAVISQGPSSARFEGPERYAEIIGVNGMPTKVACTWWSFSDWGTFAKWDSALIGAPRICTKPGTRAKLAERAAQTNADLDERRQRSDLTAPERFDRFETLTYDRLGCDHLRADKRRWNTYSGPPALALARHLALEHGITRIDCYGCDMNGTLDAHGKSGSSRNERRWGAERNTWQRLVNLCATDRIEVWRCGADGQMRQDAPRAVKAGEKVIKRFRYRLNDDAPPVSQVFSAESPQEFRGMLTRLIGPERARNAVIEEVRLDGGNV